MRPILIGLMLAWLSAWPAHADDARQAREREILRRAQQQLQQANRERASLQDQLGKSDQELETLKGEVGRVQARARSEGQRNRELQSALDAAKAEVQGLQARVAELEQQQAVQVQRNTQLEAELQQVQALRKQLESTVQARNRQFSACDLKNRELYAVGRDLIATCNGDGAQAALQRLAPFTGLERVQQENALEAARDRLDEHRLQPMADGEP